MSGAGTDAAGEGVAGEDVLPAVSAPRAVTVPPAVRFDGATFSFLYDSAGLLIPCDPVDQEVALLLLIQRGTLAGVPALGVSWRAIKRIDRRTEATVRAAVVEALAPLLASPPAIRIERIDVQTRRSPTGGFTVAVTYTNLRAQARQPRTVTV